MADSVSTKSDGAEERNTSEGGGGGGGASGRKQRPVKDKRCQFCGQQFTASSLGRHYDTFISRERVDGVHDLEEIKRIRSSVTRRTVKPTVVTTATTATSNDGHDHDHDHDDERETTEPPSQPPVATPSAPSYPRFVPPTQLNPTSGQGYRVILNQPSWEATGVINDIPNPAQTSRHKIAAGGFELGRSKGSSSQETVRALELALQEVLDSVKAASARTQPPPSPFDIDIETLTFPAICLFALPPAPSLFSTAPFSSPNCLPLITPTVAERDVVVHALRTKIFQWKSDYLMAAAESEKQRNTNPNALSEEYSRDVESIERIAMHHAETLVRHVGVALTAWMAYSPELQRDIWQLEVMRAFVKESEKRKQAESQLARTQQEVNRLKAQIEKLASCQWPREFAIFPPEMLPLPPTVARELASNSNKYGTTESPRWDYDQLVGKWKRVVKHDMTMGRPGGAFEQPPNTHGAPNRNQNENSNASSFNDNRTLPNPRQHSPPPRFNNSSNNNPDTKTPPLDRGTGDAATTKPPKRRRTSHPDDQHLPSISASQTPVNAPSPFQAPAGYYPPSGGTTYQSPYPGPLPNGVNGNGGSGYDRNRIPSLHAVPGMSEHLGPPSTHPGNQLKMPTP